MQSDFAISLLLLVLLAESIVALAIAANYELLVQVTLAVLHWFGSNFVDAGRSVVDHDMRSTTPCVGGIDNHRDFVIDIANADGAADAEPEWRCDLALLIELSIEGRIGAGATD